jgi:16S rRNA A1518/A1519 N6-dimethyltransferase RsmA/KsgA/DIM1 with predicted DNA glycosylase/AP lyase activity
MIWNNINNVNKKKEQVKTAFEERKKKAKEVLRGCLAETVDYRKELATEDSKAENVRQLLSSITPQDFSSVSQETARNII